VEALIGAVRHRRGLVRDRRVLQQRLHDQLQALCPGLSAPAGHGRVLDLQGSIGQAVLACAADIAAVEGQITQLLAVTPGQILITLPGVAEVRAAAFAAHSLPITRFPTPEHLYAATGLAPTTWQSASLKRRGHLSRQGLPEHRDALMGIAWGLSQHSPSFRERDAELRSRGMRPIQARVALARHACRLCYALLTTQQPFDEARYRAARHSRGR
jgi:transposase